MRFSKESSGLQNIHAGPLIEVSYNIHSISIMVELHLVLE
jgi:hypothetical protein